MGVNVLACVRACVHSGFFLRQFIIIVFILLMRMCVCVQ